MDLKDEGQIKRLRRSMEYSRLSLRAFREKRMIFLKEYVGYNYALNGATDRVPINLIELAVNIYMRQLAAKNPQVMVATRHMELKPTASLLELAINQLLLKMKFENTMRRVVLDALFSVGVVKIGLETVGQVDVDGNVHEAGQPFVDVIDLDDWVHDMQSKRWDHIAYCGNRYRLPIDVVRDYPLFDKDLREVIKPTFKQKFNESGDMKSETISQGVRGDMDEPQDYVELWDLYLPRERLLVTLPGEGDGKPLRVQEWDGPKDGPFRMLYFSEVPSNIMPLAPVMNLYDLHDLQNRIFRKLGRQAERQKTILGVRAIAAKDGERVIKANDGDAIQTEQPEGMKEFRFGGIDQSNFAFAIQAKDLFSYLGGNLDELGGLSPQAKTLGQEKLMQASSSVRIADMQDRAISFAQETITDVTWYLWTDPLINLPLTKRVEGFEDIQIPVNFTDDSKKGDFYDYNIAIQPYSMQDTTPSMKLQTLTQVFQTFLIPFAQQLQQEGITINFEGILRNIARYTNMDELEEIIKFAQVNPMYQQQMVGQPPQKISAPSQTVRRYERVNRPGATRQGKDQTLVSMLLGKGVQPDQAASLTRPIS